jgi:hypothetical protein
MSKNIIFIPRGPVRSPDITLTSTEEGVGIISTDVVEITDEYVPVIGRDVPLIERDVPTQKRLVKRKNRVPRVIPKDENYSSCPEVNYLLPWSEMDIPEGDCKKYLKRHINSKPVILLYSIFIVTIVLFAALRYRRDDYFWLIFSMGIFWWLFGFVSIWYATLHEDMYIGMILAIIFIGLMITFGYVALETRHLDIEIIMR